MLARRIRDETGQVRRFVNVYVDGDDVRFEEGLATKVRDGAEVQVLPSVAGGLRRAGVAERRRRQSAARVAQFSQSCCSS